MSSACCNAIGSVVPVWTGGASVGGVLSVFGRVGNVVAVAGDYGSTKIINQSAVAGAFVTDALNNLSGQVTFAAVQAALAAASSAVTFNNQSISSVLDFNGVKLGINVATGAMFANSIAQSLANNNNTSFGVGALASITTGLNNHGFGRASGAAVTSGNANIGLGSRTNEAVSVGGGNIAVGQNALRANTGDNNIAIGTNAATAQGAGSNNVYIGDNIAPAASTPTGNVGVGAAAFSALSTGVENVAVGAGALTAVTTGFQNVAVGGSAGSTVSGVRANNITLGWRAGQNLNSSGNVIIGTPLGTTSTPISAIDAAVADQLNIGNLVCGDFANKKVRIGTTAAGNLAAQTATLAVIQAGADSVAVLTLATLGADPGNARVHVGDRNPNGVVSSNAGSLYIRVSAATSSLYINRSAADPGTAWSLVTAVP